MRQEFVVLPVLFWLSEFFAGKKSNMAAEFEYQNLFPVYCTTKPLLLVCVLKRNKFQVTWTVFL